MIVTKTEVRVACDRCGWRPEIEPFATAWEAESWLSDRDAALAAGHYDLGQRTALTDWRLRRRGVTRTRRRGNAF
jgi:hypothetical protein